MSHLPLARRAGGGCCFCSRVCWQQLRGVACASRRAIVDDSVSGGCCTRRGWRSSGAPNVGKSTLANQLFAQQRSITADLPGTTRDWVGEMANIDGLPVMLVDTPGVRETSDAIEREAIERSGAVRWSGRTWSWWSWISRTRSDDQHELIDRNRDALLVANKSDLASSWNPANVNASSDLRDGRRGCRRTATGDWSNVPERSSRLPAIVDGTVSAIVS